MTDFYQLYSFTKIELAEVRRDARSGRKDSARRFLKFLRNGRVVEVLNKQEFPKALNVDVALLRWEISQLESECHPDSPCDQTNDISAIRHQLDVIAHFVSQKISGA